MATTPEERSRTTRSGASAALTARTVLMVLGVVGAVVLGLLLLWLSRRIITWILIAVFLAVAVNPAVELFERRLRLPRTLAISLVFLLGLGFVVGVALLFIPPLIDAGQQFTDNVPDYLRRLRGAPFVQDLDDRYQVIGRAEQGIRDLPSRIGGPGQAFSLVQSFFAGVVGSLTVLVLTFFFLIYGKQLRDQVIATMPAEHRARYLTVSQRMYRSVGGYVAGNLLISLIAGTFAYVAMIILSVPSALALAFWVAITDLLPLVGATIGAVPCVIVAFFHGWPVGVAMAVYFLVYQQVENHALQPVVMRRTTQLNPLIVLVAVLLGAELLGVLGALVAIPVAGIIQIVVQDLIDQRARRRGARARVSLEPGDGG